MKNMKKKSLLLLTALCAFMFASCNCDHDVEVPFASSLAVGSVVCSDGSVLTDGEFDKSGKEAVGIVFHVNRDPEIEGLGYAVYIRNMEPLAFSDSLGVDQGTSTSLTAEDGNANTYALFTTEDVSSPMAMKVFDLWTYGQSAYVPSVRQLALLFDVRQYVNGRIADVGGDPIDLGADGCWLWSSTEVEGQKEDKAWLYSIQSGVIQETPKDQPHRFRPVITIYNVK